MKYKISVSGEIPTAFELHCFSLELPGCGANFWVISMSSIPPAIFPDPGQSLSIFKIHSSFFHPRCPESSSACKELRAGNTRTEEAFAGSHHC